MNYSQLLFRTTNYNPVDKRSYRASIRPGYILMQDVDYLERNYPGQSHHARLLNDFTGKSKTKLASEGIFYVGLGFSYQERELYRFILI